MRHNRRDYPRGFSMDFTEMSEEYKKHKSITGFIKANEQKYTYAQFRDFFDARGLDAATFNLLWSQATGKQPARYGRNPRGRGRNYYNLATNQKLREEIRKHINKCLHMGMKDPHSIYQHVVDAIPRALANRETEEFVNDWLEGAGTINKYGHNPYLLTLTNARRNPRLVFGPLSEEESKKIDFRWFEGKDEFYGPGTEEYELLNKLEDEDWENYLNEMLSCNASVEYDSAEDQFVVSFVGAGRNPRFTDREFADTLGVNESELPEVLDEETESKVGHCLECGEVSSMDTDIQLCEKCMNLFDTDKLWELHDAGKLDALDFNENAAMRERFRIPEGANKNPRGHRLLTVVEDLTDGNRKAEIIGIYYPEEKYKIRYLDDRSEALKSWKDVRGPHHPRNAGGKIYHKYDDPGHGWLKVPRRELKKLGIDKEITGFSHQRGEDTYLEEDVDAPRFIKALEEKEGRPFDMARTREHFVDKSSKVRGYETYRPNARYQHNPYLLCLTNPRRSKYVWKTYKELFPTLLDYVRSWDAYHHITNLSELSEDDLRIFSKIYETGKEQRLKPEYYQSRHRPNPRDIASWRLLAIKAHDILHHIEDKLYAEALEYAQEAVEIYAPLTKPTELGDLSVLSRFYDILSDIVATHGRAIKEESLTPEYLGRSISIPRTKEAIRNILGVSKDANINPREGKPVGIALWYADERLFSVSEGKKKFDLTERGFVVYLQKYGYAPQEITRIINALKAQPEGTKESHHFWIKDLRRGASRNPRTTAIPKLSFPYEKEFDGGDPFEYYKTVKHGHLFGMFQNIYDNLSAAQAEYADQIAKEEGVQVWLGNEKDWLREAWAYGNLVLLILSDDRVIAENKGVRA